MKKIYSFRDNRGKLHVDCSECERGGNGAAPDKCSCGWKHKRGGRGGCFVGTPMPEIEEQAKQLVGVEKK